MANESGSYDEATRARRFAMAQALLAPNKQPIQNWAQGLAELGEGALGGYQLADLKNEANTQKAEDKASLLAALGLPSPTGAAPETVGGFQKLAALFNGGGEATPTVPPAQQIASAFSSSPPQAPATPTQQAQPMGTLPAMPPPMASNIAPTVGVDNSGPSPLDNAQWPAGPVGAPVQPRGIRNNNPLNIEAGNFTRGQPGFAGSDGRFAKFETPEQGVQAANKLLDTYGSKYGLNTPAGIIGRWAPQGENNTNAYAGAVAKQLGIGINDPITPEMRPQLIAAMSKIENGQPAAVNAIASALQGGASGAPTTAATAAPVQMDQAGGNPVANIPMAQRAQIAQLLSSNNPTAKTLGTAMLQQSIKQDAPTDEMREYNLAVSQAKAAGQTPPSFVEYKTGLKKAGAQNISIDQKTEGAFDKKAAELQATRFNDLAAEAPAAKQMMSDIQTLQDLGKNIGTGKTAQFKGAAGPIADAMGIKVEGLDDIQAYKAVVNRLAPSLRVKGSGAQSDRELANFLESLPSLGNTPGGNEMIAATMNGFQQNKMRAAEIGSQALNKEITKSEADKMLRELPDPLEDWRKSYKASKEKPAAPAPMATPKAGDTMDGYRFKGGNPADKKNWEQVI